MTFTQMQSEERRSIRSFVQSCASHFTGRVLDYGCGKQPYRDLIQAAGGAYVPYDRINYPDSHAEENHPSPAGEFDAVLCTQVIMYASDPEDLLGLLRSFLSPGGVLILTYPSLWPQLCREDFLRFTQAGMEQLLHNTGLKVIRHELRWSLKMEDFEIPVGYGFVATR